MITPLPFSSFNLFHYSPVRDLPLFVCSFIIIFIGMLFQHHLPFRPMCLWSILENHLKILTFGKGTEVFRSPVWHVWCPFSDVSRLLKIVETFRDQKCRFKCRSNYTRNLQYHSTTLSLLSSVVSPTFGGWLQTLWIPFRLQVSLIHENSLWISMKVTTWNLYIYSEDKNSSFVYSFPLSAPLFYQLFCYNNHIITDLYASTTLTIVPSPLLIYRTPSEETPSFEKKYKKFNK